MEHVTLTKTQKGKPKLAFLGYTYRLSNTNIMSQNWRCCKAKCKGSVSTPIGYNAPNIEVRKGQEHNHAPEPETVEAEIATEQMKTDATTSHLPPRRVISDVLRQVSTGGLARLGKRGALRQRIHRARRRRLGDGEEVALPRDTRFDIPDQFRTVTEGRVEVQFLRYDSRVDPGNEENAEEEEEEDDNDRLLIFCTDTMIQVLQNAEEWMIDATFKIVPRLFYQILIVHAIHHGHVIPCAYVIMPNKTQTTYERVFQVLSDSVGDNGSPRICITDFELGLQSAIRNTWPNVQLQGCFFHLCQGIWRKTQEVGLAGEYATNENLRNQIKVLSALAFLPVGEVAHTFDDIFTDLSDDTHAGLEEIYTFFETTYVGRRPARGPRRRPRFSIDTWNVRQRTEEGIPRTNNKLEGLHRGIQCMFDGPHPTMWKFLSGLQKEHVLHYGRYLQILAGEPPEAGEKKFESVNRRLRTLIQRHVDNEIDTTAFLRGVIHNVNLSV
jgi:hypothetical protein